ncbi:hypothetical protein M3M35_02360 [Fructilactobacillus myrtifloralis]|uniref:Cell division protein FtsL n=1 Tax=Fructilactobacillus myrtifloralis TaxID=2940301 RepID=A0ABY5BPC4_9LACO|nr:hypothetical protein [Fructilactobacillus myrtifloralis]USS85528.1 hypothetical protein M3M35_02360 [Fructilactobacillus myrtifloralis]
MAQNGLAEQQRTSTYSRKSFQQQRAQRERQEAPGHLRLSPFEKTIMVVGVVLVVFMMVAVVSAKNNLNAAQRSLQTVTTKSSRINQQNQSYQQELDGKQMKAIDHVVKQDQLSIADATVRNVSR